LSIVTTTIGYLDNAYLDGIISSLKPLGLPLGELLATPPSGDGFITDILRQSTSSYKMGLLMGPLFRFSLLTGNTMGAWLADNSMPFIGKGLRFIGRYFQGLSGSVDGITLQGRALALAPGFFAGAPQAIGGGFFRGLILAPLNAFGVLEKILMSNSWLGGLARVLFGELGAISTFDGVLMFKMTEEVIKKATEEFLNTSVGSNWLNFVNSTFGIELSKNDIIETAGFFAFLFLPSRGFNLASGTAVDYSFKSPKELESVKAITEKTIRIDNFMALVKDFKALDSYGRPIKVESVAEMVVVLDALAKRMEVAPLLKYEIGVDKVVVEMMRDYFKALDTAITENGITFEADFNKSVNIEGTLERFEIVIDAKFENYLKDFGIADPVNFMRSIVFAEKGALTDAQIKTGELNLTDVFLPKIRQALFDAVAERIVFNRINEGISFKDAEFVSGEFKSFADYLNTALEMTLRSYLDKGIDKVVDKDITLPEIRELLSPEVKGRLSEVFKDFPAALVMQDLCKAPCLFLLQADKHERFLCHIAKQCRLV